MTHKPDYKRAVAAAHKLLADFGVTSPPVDPISIARDLGVRVVFATFGTQTGLVSGFYDFVENTIFVNSQEAPRRQTFTVAHELGHKLLHADWVKSAEYKVLLRDAGPSEDPIEREANTFAANLLVPRFMLDRYRKIVPIDELSDLFAVSQQVVQNRIKFEYGAN